MDIDKLFKRICHRLKLEQFNEEPQEPQFKKQELRFRWQSDLFTDVALQDINIDDVIVSNICNEIMKNPAYKNNEMKGLYLIKGNDWLGIQFVTK